VRGWRRPLHGGPSGGPWLSVAVRTQARRPELLREALLCLAAQTDPDLDVLLMVHDAEPAGMSAIAEILDEHHPSFASRVRVLPVRGGGRSRPLNAALAAARGDYVAFLDDDDLVTANWVETFRAGATAAPGRIVRARTAVQEVAAPRPGDLAPYRVRSAFRTPYAASFDLAEHLVDNQSPICSLALPRAQLDTWAIRFDDSLSSHEDWDVLLRLGAAAGVESCPEVTSIYHVWAAGGSAALVGQPGWVAAQRAVVARLADSGLVVHPDLAASLLAAPRRAAQAEVALAAVEREDPGAVPPQPTEVGRARRRGGGVRRRRG
jgi:glycosyltransferase involved in cell wall biosynthesis